MHARQLVAQARGPAVATSASDRVIATNEAFLRLVGSDGRMQVEGVRLYELLRARDVFGNRLPRRPFAVLETLSDGEGLRAFEMDIAARGRAGQRVSVSPVVVLGDGDVYDLVYYLRSVHRRRRADLVIDRLLATTEPGTRGGLPEWWHQPATPDEDLTPRQREVLRRLSHGESTAEIACTLGVSVHTVRSHVRDLYERIDVHNRAEAVAWAMRHQVF